MSTWFRTYGFAEILDDLVIGAFPRDAEDVSMLDWMGVQRVVNLVEDEEYREADREAVAAALAAAGITEQRVKFTDFGNLPADELEAAVQEVCRGLRDGAQDLPSLPGRPAALCRRGGRGGRPVTQASTSTRRSNSSSSEKPSAAPLPHQLEDLQALVGRIASPAASGSTEDPSAGSDPRGDEDLLRGP